MGPTCHFFSFFLLLFPLSLHPFDRTTSPCLLAPRRRLRARSSLFSPPPAAAAGQRDGGSPPAPPPPCAWPWRRRVACARRCGRPGRATVREAGRGGPRTTSSPPPPPPISLVLRLQGRRPRARRQRPARRRPSASSPPAGEDGHSVDCSRWSGGVLPQTKSQPAAGEVVTEDGPSSARSPRRFSRTSCAPSCPGSRTRPEHHRTPPPCSGGGGRVRPRWPRPAAPSRAASRIRVAARRPAPERSEAAGTVVAGTGARAGRRQRAGGGHGAPGLDLLLSPRLFPRAVEQDERGPQGGAYRSCRTSGADIQEPLPRFFLDPSPAGWVPDVYPGPSAANARACRISTTRVYAPRPRVRNSCALAALWNCSPHVRMPGLHVARDPARPPGHVSLPSTVQEVFRTVDFPTVFF